MNYIMLGERNESNDLSERYPMSYSGVFLFSVRKPGFESP